MTSIPPILGPEHWGHAEPNAPARGEAAGRSGDSIGEQFGEVLRAIGAELDRGEDLVAGVARGAVPLDPVSLIALQAGIYRWGEAVDLTAKVVDRLGSAVRVTLQNGSG